MNTGRIFPYQAFLLLLLLSSLFISGCPFIDTEDQVEEARFAACYEFLERPDGLSGLQEMYDFQFDAVYGMAIGLTHEALRAGDVEAAMGYATDGKIRELDLVKLEDDRGFFTNYFPAPVIREEVLERYPRIEGIMAEVAASLDTDTILRLNYLVDIELEEPQEVAREWLLEQEIISAVPEREIEGEPVIVGSKDYTEQKNLGQITLLALRNAGIPVIDSTKLGGTRKNRSILLSGGIHIYWEYTGTAWAYFFKEEIIDDAEEVYRRIALEDAEQGLIWLDYANIDNTYVIMMRREDAEKLRITNISQLAEWVRQVQHQRLD